MHPQHLRSGLLDDLSLLLDCRRIHPVFGVKDHRPRLRFGNPKGARRSEEHTSELQSLTNLVCRLLLEKKKRHISTAVQRHKITRPTTLIKNNPTTTKEERRKKPKDVTTRLNTTQHGQATHRRQALLAR